VQVASNSQDIAFEFAAPLYVILDLQTGSLAGPAPTTSGDMVISYVRAWVQ
jgi:hypothetical protein